ncbi:proliferating cell nuclear antigen [Acanthamoeba castellanii medusavirus]|uniref:Proliferating cell nuclear antigen n=1 Tax=Acanthamoeba castellanii medusavirus J1 TaxID=3114988 RepID=A0A3T1CXD1_9VIRU|nr:proliferating cell nuclear antigen [Acanthamoeba castellanii medusavirus]BBI30486.1 proliferating cell nuclear antigen [Acanthamoeba castellanii medusavirus J1]
MQVELTDSLILGNIVKSIKDVVQDFNISISREGMRVVQMDSSHVALVDLELRADGFDRFEVARPFTIGVNSATLDEFLKMGAKKDTSVALHMDNPEDSVLHMVFTRHDGSRSSRCKIALLNIETDLLDLSSEIKDAFVLTMPSSEFRDIIRGLAVVGDAFTVETKTQDQVTISSSGAKGSLDEDICALAGRVTVHATEPIKVILAARYLVMFVSCCYLASEVTLRVNREMPSRVCYAVNRRKGGDMEEDVTFANLNFWLAPKLEDTDS